MKWTVSPAELGFQSGVDLGERTSMGVGGDAEAYFAPSSVREFRDAYMALWRAGVEPFILGGGCNTIFPQGSFERPVIHTERLRGFTVEGSMIRAEAGLRLEALIRVAIECGLGGLERFRGIPGTVGGAIAMNAGGSGREFGELVRAVRALDPTSGDIVELRGDEICWSYRHAELGGLVIVAADLELTPSDAATLRRDGVEFLRWKAARQPLGSHTSGCVFRNPSGDSAGRLIQAAGLKGLRVGHAVVSPRHANFVVNEGGRARSDDIFELIRTVREKVFKSFGVELELEVVIAEELAGSCSRPSDGT